MKRLALLLILILFSTGVAEAAKSLAKPIALTIDPARSHLEFLSTTTFADVTGRFAEWSGALQLEPGNSEKSSVAIHIRTASVDTGLAMRDKHLRSKDFFFSENFPDISFQSTSILPDPSQDNFYRVTGNLSVRDIVKEISFPATIVVEGKTVTAKGDARLKRQDFGILYRSYFNPIGDQVTIRFEIVADDSPKSPEAAPPGATTAADKTGR